MWTSMWGHGQSKAWDVPPVCCWAAVLALFQPKETGCEYGAAGAQGFVARGCPAQELKPREGAGVLGSDLNFG